MTRLSASVLALSLMMVPACAMAQQPPASASAEGGSGGGSSNSDTYRALSLFGDVFERVKQDYVEAPEDEELVENALNGMLSSLDPHSSYMGRKAYADMQVQTRGEFGGLGIEVTMENGAIRVVSPIDDTPAAKAGIQPGDLITALEGEPVMGMSLNDAVEKMRGAPDTDITITVLRGETEPFDIKLTRAVIKVRSVRHEVKDNVGYIRITSFTEQTQQGMEAAIADIEQKLGDKLVGYVLDLRNNPGGLLEQAVSVSDSFLESGEIVSTKGRNPEDVDRRNATPGDLAKGKPVVVLINGGSASASEIVSGALQDHHRAILLGTKSFGKGSVQTIMPVPGHGAIRLTTARYFTPSGRSIQAEGIEPDIEVHPAKVEEIDEGRLRSEADLRGALSNPTREVDKKETETEPKPEEGADATPTEAPTPPPGGAAALAEGANPQQAEDYQLSRAIDLLQGVSLFAQQQK